MDFVEIYLQVLKVTFQRKETKTGPFTMCKYDYNQPTPFCVILVWSQGNLKFTVYYNGALLFLEFICVKILEQM